MRDGPSIYTIQYMYSRVGLSRTSRDMLFWFDLDQIRLKLSLDLYQGGTRESEIGSTQVKVRLILVRLKPTILYKCTCIIVYVFSK